MNIYRLKYQHYKDIVDDNVLTVFVLAKNEDEVRAFAKKLTYKVEDVTQVTQEEYEREKEKYDHFGLEHAENYLD
ncbi:hypothetical protein N9R04_09660 [Staphylococcus sp. SQ8-PEA]|uniref:DUF1447-containing protein n=1 Tax=Staphylococcus marylandisciuri TaxID=2981529 RepID=A0ABT2QSH0_9STAP|nr:hypothetical protein [Staphylococcus marylandisciuri]MCU5746943.1 hypothetical protein [Staphylococcus marylandisciuri]